MIGSDVTLLLETAHMHGTPGATRRVAPSAGAR